MNRKIKKYVTTGAVVLFFGTAGMWYLFHSNGVKEKQKDDTQLTSVWDTMELTEQMTPALEDVSTEEKEKASEMIVYVCGAVNTPGIYTLEAGSRLYEAVILAGGFSAEADPTYHNLARPVIDGERIYILSSEETQWLTAEQQAAGEEGAADSTLAGNGSINLNTATAEQLMELPGIGEARATDILAYRAKIGQFTNIEEIMNVSGIGEAMFEKIKDKIVVK